MYNKLFHPFLRHSPWTIFDIMNHANGMLNILTSRFTRNIDQFQQLFQKMPELLDNFLKTNYYRFLIFHLILPTSHLRPDLRKKDSIYSRSILMVSYGPKKRSYSSWFSRITRRHLLTTKKSEVPSDATISPTTLSLLSNMNHGRTPRTLFHLALCQKSSNLSDPRFPKEFMSRVKVPIDQDGFANSRRTEDYDPSSIFRHSIVLQFEMQDFLPSSTTSSNHSQDIQYTLDSTYSQDTTLEYFTPRVVISPLFKHHLDFYDIHVYLKASPILLPSSRTAPRSSYRTKFLFTLEL